MNQRQYSITINGVTESISQIDALLQKLNEIENRLKNINTSSLNTSSSKQSSSATGTEAKQQQEVAQAARTTAEENQRNLEALAGINRQLAENTNLQKEAMEIADRILGSNSKLHELNEQYKRDLETIKLDRKEIDTLEKYGQVSAEEAMQRRTALAQKEMEIKTARQQNLVVLRNEQKLLSAEEGSYEQISYTLSRLKEALKSVNADNLSPEDLQKLAGAIDETDRKAKAMAASMGEFQRNVGNYGSAFAGIEGLKIKIGETEAEFSNAREAIRALRNAMTELALEGKTDTEQFQQYEEALKGIQMASIKVSDSIDRAKDASTGLHDAIEMFEGMASITAVGQGVSNLFGVDDGEIQKKIQQMTSLIGVMNGLQKLSTQMATGTGIGPALKKLFDTAGSNPVEMFKNVRDQLKGMFADSEEASGGFLKMGNVMNNLKKIGTGLWKGLVAGIATGGLMMAIDLAISGFQELFQAIKDAFSLDDDAARSMDAYNNALRANNETLKYNIELIEQRARLEGMGSVETEREKLEATTKALKEYSTVLESNIAVQNRAADEFVKLVSGVDVNDALQGGGASIEQLNEKVMNLNKSLLEGQDVEDDLRAASVQLANAIMGEFAKIDKSSEQSVQGFSDMVNGLLGVQIALSHLGEDDDYFGNIRRSLADMIEKVHETSLAFYSLRNEMQATDASLAKDIENWSIEGIADSTERALKKAEQAYNDDIKSIRERAKNADEERKAIEARDAAYEQQVKTIRESNRKIGASASSTRKTRVNEAERTARELAQIEKQIQLDKINAMRDGLTKTLELIKREREERLKALEKYKGNAKYEGLVNDTNAIFDDREQKARLEFVKEYGKAIDDLRTRIRDLEHESSEANAGYVDVLHENDNISKEFAMSVKFINKNLEDAVEKYERWHELFNEVANLQDEIQKRREKGDKSTEYDILEAEYVNKAKELLELDKELQNTNVVADKQNESLKLWSEYYKQKFALQHKSNKFELIAEQEAIKERFDYEKDKLKERLDNELEALDEFYRNLIDDEDALKELGKTREQAIEEWSNNEYEIISSYNTLILYNNTRKDEEILRADNEYREKEISETENFYDNLIGENDKYANHIMNKASELEKNNTNSWGIINLPKLRKQRKEAEMEIERLLKEFRGLQVAMRAMAQAGMISPDSFKKFNDEIDNMIDKLNEAEEELKDTDPIGSFISSINPYIQEVGNAISSLMSSIYDYQESLLDAEEDALDKQNDILDKKLTEQEEITRRHKEAIDDIENELKTARGDRRDALIDQLNAEVAAQRASLAAEKRIKAQQEALQKKQDALDLRRKNMQKEQSETQAIISAALATANGYATQPFIPVGLAMGTLAAALGAAQVALISKQKFAEGGEINGPSHAQGGVPVEVEGGEFVVNRRAYSSNEELVRLINSAGRRLTIADLQTVGYDAPGAIETRFNEPIVVSSQEPIYVSVVDINNAQSRVARVTEMAR